MTEASVERPATADRTALDRFLALVPLAAGALVILMVLFWEAAVRKTPTVFVDELEWAQLSRAIADTGRAAQRGEPASFKSLYSFVIAPAWWLHSTAAAYTAVKYINMIVMACAAVPVWFLARRLVSAGARGDRRARHALHLRVLLCTLPPPRGARLPDVLPVRVSVRALARGRRAPLDDRSGRARASSRPRSVRSSSVSAARSPWPRPCSGSSGRAASELRRGWSRSDNAGAALLCLGALIVLNALISDHSNEWAVVTQNYQGRMWRLVLEACSALVIGLGILPAIAGLASLWLPERKHDSAWRAFAAFTARVDLHVRRLHRHQGRLPVR